VFLVVRDVDDGYTIDIPEHSKVRPEACRTDSESRFWQQKNFSRLAPRRLIGARQTPIPVESNAPDSGPRRAADAAHHQTS
jgi:hypothetical protein